MWSHTNRFSGRFALCLLVSAQWTGNRIIQSTTRWIGAVRSEKRDWRHLTASAQRDVTKGRSAHTLGYTDWMRSVADALRARTITQVLAMSPGERIALALSLGDDDLELFIRASGLDRGEALGRLRAGRRHGRTPSRSAGNDGA